MKRLFPIIIVLLILIFGSIFLFRSCEPRTKNPTTNSETNTESPLVQDEIAKYQNPFINANVEMTCLLYNQNQLRTDEPAIATAVEEAYARNGLPTNNNQLMIQILKKYETDNDTIAIIKKNAEPCKTGNAPILNTN